MADSVQTLAVQMAELRDDIRAIRGDFNAHDQADQQRHVETRQDMAQLRTELRSDLTGLRTELREDIRAAASSSTRVQLAQLGLVLAALAILGGLVGVKLAATPDGGLHVEGATNNPVTPAGVEASP